MMKAQYYFPLKSLSLAHYFGHACVIPGRYLPNKPRDIQNKYDEFLLLSKRLGHIETDCCLELIITEDEVNLLHRISDDLYLLPKPLPISRVKTIFFFDKMQMEKTIVNIIMSTATIPEQLVKIIDKFDAIEINKDDLPVELKSKNWCDQLFKFDSYLGGFALMRLGGEDYMNYSENYFSTLSYFNEAIKSEYLKSGRNISTIYFDAFTGENRFKKLFPLINKVIDDNDLTKIANDEKQTILKDRITRNINLNALEKATYIVAVLYTYGVGDEARKKKVDGLILSNFKSEIKPEVSEIVSLLYGMNRGYSVFSNKYTSGGNEKVVKFQLNSLLDYYTIESLYQFCFNGKKSEVFEYLDWCPKMISKNIQLKKSDYYILDVVVVGKKKAKVSSREYLGVLLQRYFQKETENYFKELIEDIVKTVSGDYIEEVQDQLTQKDEIISKLQKEIFKVEKLEHEIERLMSDNQNIKRRSVQESATLHEVIDVPAQPPLTISHSEKDERKDIIKKVLAYTEKNKKSLENEAKFRGLDVPKGTKVEDLILLLMISPENTDNKLL